LALIKVADTTKLQEDIDALQNWESTWQMSFNPDKCEVLRITNKRNKIMANYYIHGKQLQIVDNAKYLGGINFSFDGPI
jgi:myo-inositol-hexaphosphate 3-phosphohydrolase